MTARPVRSLLSELAIGAALCGGAYVMLVEPADRKLASARAGIGAIQSRAEQPTGPELHVARRALADAAARREALTGAGRLARSESEAFAAIMAAAAAHRVRINRLQPVTTGAPTPSPIGTDPEGNEPVPAFAFPDDARGTYSVATASSYADLAAFADDLQRRFGLAVVNTLRVAPTGEAGGTTVHASMTIDLLAIGAAVPTAAADAGTPEPAP